MEDTFTIPCKLPSLNDYIRACRSNSYAGATMKRNTEKLIEEYIEPLRRFKEPIYIYFDWHESTRRRDCDNIAFAKKFILDSLVKAGKIRDDNSLHVVGFTDTFSYGGNDAVIVTIKSAKED